MTAKANRSRLPAFVVGLAAALVAAAVALTVVALRPPGEPRTLQERVRAVASTLRCPVCQDLSVADSPSGLARQMRARIASDLKAGTGPDEIRAEFVRSYGDWILLSPPRRGLNLLVWLGPVLLLLGGLAVAGVAVRRWTLGTSPVSSRSSPTVDADGMALSAQDRRLLDRALAAAEEEPE